MNLHHARSCLLTLACGLAAGSAVAQTPASTGPISVSLGDSCGVPAPVLTITPPTLGQATILRVTSEFPNAHSFLFVSLATSNFFELVPGCFVYLDLNTAMLLADLYTDGNGQIVLAFPPISDPAAIGVHLNYQAAVWAPGGVQGLDHLSNGVGVRIGTCGECDGKVSELTLLYRGSVANANIEVKQNNGAVRFSGIVQPGGTFSFFGTDHDTLGKEIKIRVNGGAETKIHTSCSKPIGAGLVVGDFEVLAGASKDGGPLCPISSCDLGKPCGLTMRYTGGDCSGTSHTQDPGKVTCSGNPAMAPLVTIRATEKSNPNDTGGRIWFEGQVALGDTFFLSAANAGEDKLNSSTFVHIFAPGGALLQTVGFHTSCSQPLHLFDQFGAVRLEDFFAEGNCAPTAGSDLCAGGGKPAVLTMTYTGSSCAATAHGQDAGKVSCTGDPAMAPMVMVRASDKSNPADTSAKVWFQGLVSLDAAFTINASNAGETRLTNATHVHVLSADGSTVLQQVEFHTSCSQPLVIGNQFGALRLDGFVAE